MPGLNRTRLSTLIVSFGAGGTLSGRRGAMQTLLVGVTCVKIAGFASQRGMPVQGWRSLRELTPGYRL